MASLFSIKSLIARIRIEFDSSYSYTDLGYIEGPVDWEALSQQGDIEVVFFTP